MNKKCYIRNLIIVALVGTLLTRVYYRATDDFRLYNISYDMAHQEMWEIPKLSSEEYENLNSIFDQEFNYIGKGAQSYAFASQDDKYVIKFFKFKHLRPSWFVDHLPDIEPLKSYKELQQYKKRRKLLSVFNGYRLAYGVHKSEAGLLYIHLNKGKEDLKKSVVVRDKIGIKRTINLDDVNFVVQEKVQTSRHVINTFLSQGDVLATKRYIRKIFDLYLSEYAKGVYDHDHGVMHNTGFIGERAIHLDVGKLYRDEDIQKPEFAKKDLEVVAAKICLRIQETFPQYLPTISSDIQQYFKKAFDPENGFYQRCLLGQ